MGMVHLYPIPMLFLLELVNADAWEKVLPKLNCLFSLQICFINLRSKLPMKMTGQVACIGLVSPSPRFLLVPGSLPEVRFAEATFQYSSKNSCRYHKFFYYSHLSKEPLFRSSITYSFLVSNPQRDSNLTFLGKEIGPKNHLVSLNRVPFLYKTK